MTISSVFRAPLACARAPERLRVAIATAAGLVALVGAARPAAAQGISTAEIKLSYTCGNIYRIRNGNAAQVTLTYTVYRTTETGSITLPAKSSVYAYSETYLQTVHNGALRIFYGGTRVATRDNGGAQCSPLFTQGMFSSLITWSIPGLNGTGGAAYPILPVHMAVLPSGKILSWGRRYLGVPVVWDPDNTSSFTPVDARLSAADSANLFCGGQTITSTGNVFVAGGHFDDYVGTPYTFTFSSTAPYSNSSWTEGATMNEGRWYPTTTALADGTFLVIGGTSDTSTYDSVAQVYSADGSTVLRNLTGANPKTYLDFYYPWMFVDPEGRGVFSAGSQQTSAWVTTSGVGSWVIGPTRDTTDRDYGSAVMWDVGKIIVMGGAHTQATAYTIDLTQGSPMWTETGSMQYPRRQLSAVLLADDEVLVTGGSAGPDFNPATNIVYAGEIWNSATGLWRTVASAHVERLYHSTTVLIADGRVVSGGGGDPPATGLSDQHNSEFYYPYYLYNPDGTTATASRPIVTSAPASVAYGSQFTLGVQNVVVAKVVAIRLGASTHAFNHSQVGNVLSFSQSADGGTLIVTAPVNANAAPPGPYFIFVLNSWNVPSIGQVVYFP